MNIKQQYIVLYAQDGKTTLGFVKLTFQGEEALVQAQATLRADGNAELCLESATASIRLPMVGRRPDFTASGSLKIGNGRIVAAVCGTKGLLALGQSMMPKAFWNVGESMCKANRQKHAMDDEAVPEAKAGSAQAVQKQTVQTAQIPVSGQAEAESPEMMRQAPAQDEEVAMQHAQCEPMISPMQDAAQEPGMEPSPVLGDGSRMAEREMPAQDQMHKRVPMITPRSRLWTISEQPAASGDGELAKEQDHDSGDWMDQRDADQSMEDDYPDQNAPPVYDSARIIKTGDHDRQHDASDILLSVMGPYANLWRWRRVVSREADYSYLMGEVVQGGKVVAVAVAVPGSYAPSPPANLQGFHAYRDGHWILAQDAQTGDIIDI